MTKLLDLSDIAFVSYPIVPLRWFFALARLQGIVRQKTNKRLSLTVRNNLASLIPGLFDTELDTRTRRFFEYSRLRELLFLLAPKMTDQTLSELCPVEGLDQLDRCRASGRGVILLASHLNSRAMFLLVVMLKRRGYDIRVAVPTETDPWAPTAFRTLINRRCGLRTYFEYMGALYSQFNIRPITRALAEGAIVMQTGDGWHSAGFVEVDFLNRRLPFTTGMIRVAQLTGVPVVPFFIAGAPPDSLRFVIEEPFTVGKTEAVEIKVAGYAKRLEHYLLQHPECWTELERPDLLQTWSNWPKRSLRERHRL
jgi:lauroyl/myristoyl acyltransferase